MPPKVKKFRFKMPVKLLDSTTITVPLSMFDWAHYNTKKGAVKSHTVLNDETKLPEYVYITDGKYTDNKAAYNIPIMPHSIVVADRGYCDYGLLNYWDSIDVFFVVRCKNNVRFTSIEELPLPDKTAQDVLIDEEIEFELPNAKKKYPKHLRRIVVWNDEHEYQVELLTNNFKLAASSISALYRERWRIEFFFRDLKGSLSIRSFIGTTRNAVEIQIWTAMITMLILAWLKYISKYGWGMSNLVSTLRLNTFTKIDLMKWLNDPFTPPPEDMEEDKVESIEKANLTPKFLPKSTPKTMREGIEQDLFPENVWNSED